MGRRAELQKTMTPPNHHADSFRIQINVEVVRRLC